MYIGMDLGGTNIKLGLFDKRYHLLSNVVVATQGHKGAQQVLENMLRGIKQLLKSCGITSKEIEAIGVGIPGLLDMKRGISLFSPNFKNWQNVPITEIFEAELSIPVFIDNDVRMNLYGEWQFGVGQGKKNILLTAIGTGLGSAIIIDNQVFYGSVNNAGELGHMNMYRKGRACACGSSGCLGRYVSARGIVKTVEEKLLAGQNSIIEEWIQGDHGMLTAQMVSEAYDLEDSLAIEVFKETGEMLGFGLASMINLFNPEMIIIGGGVSNSGERWFKFTRQVIATHALKLSREVCSVKISILKELAGVYGAAFFAAQKGKVNRDG